MRRGGVLAVWLLCGATSVAEAALTPDEIVILTTPSRTSRDVAQYYAEHRGVPANHIVLLDVKPDTDVDRATWDKVLRPKIRALLAQQKLDSRVRCLVTSWDVPLRIGPRRRDLTLIAARKEQLERAYTERSARLAQSLRALDAVGTLEAAGTTQKAKPRAELEAQEPIRQRGKTIDAAIVAARQRIEKLDVHPKLDAGAALEKCFQQIHGLAGKVQAAANAERAGQLSARSIAQLLPLDIEAARLDKELRALNAKPESVQRDREILATMDRLFGSYRTLIWIDHHRTSVDRDESQASFDSELSLLFWDDEYPLGRWLPNGLHYDSRRAPDNRRTVMVTRLSAPKVDAVLKMIDTSIAVEKAGLSGKVYIDARGIAYDAKAMRGSYGEYDQSLRDLAERLRKHTKLDVVLDDKNPLFAAGQCPDAALYCGWYSLANYVDAFTWRPGAVGYHIASSEAVDLRHAGSRLWCPAMLERGVVATLGPTFEPYLGAFPLPDDLFPLLLTGRYTLAETYWRTCPYTSWAMVLVGDPLYNPYKNHPAIAEKDLPERMRILGPKPAATK